MKRLLCVLLFIYGCNGGSERYPIAKADLQPGHYITVLNEVKSQLRSDPNNVELLYKKLFISQQLKWPEDVSQDLQTLIDAEGLTPELYRYATSFYKANAYYEQLLAIVDRWLSFSKSTPEDLKLKIQALNGLQRYIESQGFLWTMLQESNQQENLVFIAREYLSMKDTARAIYAFSRLARKYPTEPVLVEQYVPILLGQGYPDKAREVLLAQKDQLEGFEDQMILARALFQLGDRERAIQIVGSYDRPEAFARLADWYHQLRDWDSAVYYADKVIAQDSSSHALLKKGIILEDRGWLYAAHSLYEVLLAKDSTDSIALERTQIVGRKIAYLRKLREKEQEIPVLEVSPKKETDNE